MQHFKLPKIHGNQSPFNDVIFFSCDEKYYQTYGIALIKSIIDQINWISVHCHIIHENQKTIDYVDHPRVTHTWEIIDQNFINSIPYDSSKNIGLSKSNLVISPKIVYYACCRFMQVDKIFSGDKRILQIDCDTILYNIFNKQAFYEVTNGVRAMRKPKTPEKIIASTLSFGYGEEGKDFRKLLANKMFSEFSKGCYWFIDQIVLQEIFAKRNFLPIPQNWNTWSFKKKQAFFRTGKGNKKETNELYTEKVHYWKNKELNNKL